MTSIDLSDEDQQIKLDSYDANLGNKIELRAARAYEAVCKAWGEPAEYLVGSTVISGPQGAPATCHYLMMAIKALDIGQKVHTTALIPDLWVSQDALEALMNQMVEQLKQARTREAHSVTQQAGQSQGLITP